MLLSDWTCEAAAGQRPDEEGDESHGGCDRLTGLSPAELESQDYKASQFSGGSADDAKPPLYGNDSSALSGLKVTWDTNSGALLFGFTLNMKKHNWGSSASGFKLCHFHWCKYVCFIPLNYRVSRRTIEFKKKNCFNSFEASCLFSSFQMISDYLFRNINSMTKLNQLFGLSMFRSNKNVKKYLKKCILLNLDEISSHISSI